MIKVGDIKSKFGDISIHSLHYTPQNKQVKFKEEEKKSPEISKLPPKPTYLLKAIPISFDTNN